MSGIKARVICHQSGLVGGYIDTFVTERLLENQYGRGFTTIVWSWKVNAIKSHCLWWHSRFGD
jgi:hypothetical protein